LILILPLTNQKTNFFIVDHNIIMHLHNYPSKLLESAVNEFAKFPGVGRKTALRMVLHLLKQEPADIENFGNTILRLRKEIRYCKKCHNISDREVCDICSDSHRESSLVCVVENIRDVMSIENTNQFHGLYHVLGGIISPMDGVGPSDLNIPSLEEKINSGEIEEIILALSTTMEGDTTNFYLYRKFSKYDIKITTIARGISIGDELEYADEVTLGRSILNRTPFESSFPNSK
jgi:recombination protein RecR